MRIDGNKLIEERFLTMTFPVLIYLHSANVFCIESIAADTENSYLYR